ncbi:Histone-Lysine N-Methyltransferase Setd5 [Manis pentadactyla]|nr:Histone-Lysine N-Methyltransferase Setd5 [Manis pentadactyla]
MVRVLRSTDDQLPINKFDQGHMAQELTFFDDSSGVELVLRAGTEAKGESPGVYRITKGEEEVWKSLLERIRNSYCICTRNPSERTIVDATRLFKSKYGTLHSFEKLEKRKDKRGEPMQKA